MNQASLTKIIRLGLGLATFGVVFYALRSLDIVPAMLESIDPGNLGTPTGATQINGLELAIAAVVAGIVVWRYQADVVALITGTETESKTPPTAREQLAGMDATMPDADRLHLEELTLQAIYEQDIESVNRCIEKLTGAKLTAKLVTPAKPATRAKRTTRSKAKK